MCMSTCGRSCAICTRTIASSISSSAVSRQALGASSPDRALYLCCVAPFRIARSVSLPPAEALPLVLFSFRYGAFPPASCTFAPRSVETWNGPRAPHHTATRDARSMTCSPPAPRNPFSTNAAQVRKCATHVRSVRGPRVLHQCDCGAGGCDPEQRQRSGWIEALNARRGS